MEYLEEYAANRVFNERPIASRIQYATLVMDARKQGNLWKVKVQNTLSHQQRTLVTRKLIVASGMTTVPNVPQIPGASTFQGPVHISVLEGGKSGVDMVYTCAKAGKSVAWIVRPSGTGPCIFVGAKGKGPFKNTFELAYTRAAEALQPSHFASDNRLTDFLHRTQLGRTIVGGVLEAAHKEAVADADYANRPSRGDFNRLVPHTSIFWRNNAAGIVNQGDFYGVVANLVDVYYDHVSRLYSKDIRLESGRSFRTDALLLGTGWQSPLGYLQPSLQADLGYLTRSVQYVDVISRYPILANPPEHTPIPVREAPVRLYNPTVPVDDVTRSFACIGMVETTNDFRTTEVQSFWVTAYFDGKLQLSDLEERMNDVAHTVAWNRRRYLSSGTSGSSLSFDTVRYIDRLLAQLGLTSHLKRGLAYFFSSNRARDYAELRAEYKKRFGDRSSDDTGL